MINLNVTRKLLYDGSETEMPSKFVIKVDSNEIELSRSDLTGTSLRELAAIVSEEDFNRIASRFTKEQFGTIILFRVDGLDGYYVIKDGNIIVISFGETQPDRYRIYFEGVWLKE